MFRRLSSVALVVLAALGSPTLIVTMSGCGNDAIPSRKEVTVRQAARSQ
jgi:hypothetical protein